MYYEYVILNEELFSFTISKRIAMKYTHYDSIERIHEYFRQIGNTK